MRRMTGHTSQCDLENGLEPYKSLSFQVNNCLEGETSPFPVAVKNLTTVGVILEILHVGNGLKTESLKGREGLLTIVSQNDCVMNEVPGKILWTHKRDGEAGVTLGLELLEPLPLSVRQRLETTMAIGAKDMKVLWDYWDEIKEAAAPVESPELVMSSPSVPDHEAAVEGQTDVVGSGDNWWYWLGFGAILFGLGMQYPQSEYFGFLGLIAMFLGSLVIAWKSIASMRQVSSSGPVD